MTRGQLLTSAATGIVGGLVSGATYVQSTKVSKTATLELVEKEQILKALRAPMEASLKNKSAIDSRDVNRFLDRAKREHEKMALAGHGTSQYLLGKCFQFAAECQRAQSQVASQLDAEAMAWFVSGAKSSHPACKFLTAKGGHRDNDDGYRNTMRECILLGSVDAVYAMNGIDDAVFPGSSTAWLNHGPYVVWPNRGGYYDTCEEAIRYWLVFAFFSLRWDPSKKFFSVGLPISDLWLGLLLPVSDDSPSPPLIPDVVQMVKSMEWAYERACQIQLNYLPSEIWTVLW